MRSLLLAFGLTLLAGACVPGQVDYSSLRTAADARQRSAGSALVPRDATVQSLLARPLTAESAAGIALLNNRGVRAKVEELGIAEAELVQARRLPNPTLEGAARFEGDDRPELEVAAMIDVTDLLLLASRSAAASSSVDAARLSAVGSLLDLSFDARRGFYAYQAAAESFELRRTVLAAYDASADLAARLHQAGNITDLDLANQESQREEARLDLQLAEVAMNSAREQLNALLGLWGLGIEWKAEPRLPRPPAQELDVDRLESNAVARSLDLAVAKARFGAAARRVNVATASGFLPELKAGVSAEREQEWGVGPALEIELPLFYQGQGEVGVAKAQMRQQQNLYTDAAVGIRAAARGTAVELRTKREAALYYKDVLLPLKQRVVEQSQLEYNAMQIGLFQLLQAKRDQVQTAVMYVQHLRDYWLARTNAEQLLAGRRHPGSAASAAARPSSRELAGH